MGRAVCKAAPQSSAALCRPVLALSSPAGSKGLDPKKTNQEVQGPGFKASLVAQTVKNLPAVQEETGVRSLGWAGPLEKGTATTPGFLSARNY